MEYQEKKSRTNLFRHHARRVTTHTKVHLKRAGTAIHSDVKALTPWRIVESLAVLVIALQLSVFAINWFGSGRPVLGVKLENQPVGQLLGKDPRTQVNSIIDQHENRQLTIKAADYSGTISLRQFGEQANHDEIFNQIMRVGRNGPITQQIAEQDQAFVGAYNVRLDHANFDHTLAQDFIKTINQKVQVAPVNASFSLKDGTVIVNPDKKGQLVDPDEAISNLLAADTSESSTITLPTKETNAAVQTASLESLRVDVQRIANEPLTIAAAASTVTLTPEELVALIVPKVAEGSNDATNPTAQISFDETKLNSIIDGLVKQAAIAAQPTIMSGTKVIKQGAEGLQAKDDTAAYVLSALVERQTGVAKPTTIDIPMVKVAPPVVQQEAGNVSNRTGTGLIRLTFDDGPGAVTGEVLDILARYNVHATFYLVGRNVGGHVGQVQRMVNEGHRIGNHSYNHSDLSRLSAAGVAAEIANTQTAIQNAAGVTPTAFRPPYGALNQTVRNVAANHGLSVDMWSVDPRDWAQPGSGAIINRVLSATGPGAVVLLHTLSRQTVDALPGIIEGIRAQGYTLE